METKYLSKSFSIISLFALCFFNWGCLAVNHPPEIPAHEVSPDVSYLWPEEKTLIKKTTPVAKKLENRKSIGANNGIIAVVNDRLITLKEFDAQFFRALQARNVFKKEAILYEDILNSMVDELLLLELAYQKEVEVLPEHIEKELETVAKRHPKGWDGLKKDLEAQKSSLETFKEELKKSLMLKNIRREIVGYLNNPSPRDVQEVYQKNLKDYQSPEKRDISYITIFEGDYKNDKRLIERMTKKIETRLKQEDFKKVLISMSEDGKGGEGIKGFVEKKDLAEPIAKVAFSLKAGEWSGPHQLPGIVVFVKCHSIAPQETKTLAEVQDVISQGILNEIRYQKISMALKGIKESSYILKMPHTEYFEYRRSLTQ